MIPRHQRRAELSSQAEPWRREVGTFVAAVRAA
jgi:hypothetical protein